MRTAKCLILTLILGAAIVAIPSVKTSAGDAETQAAPLSNTRVIECIVKVTADAELIPLNDQTLTHLVNSSGVIGKAAQDALRMSPEALSNAGRILGIEVIDACPQRPQVRSKSTDEMMDAMRSLYGTTDIQQSGSEGGEPAKRRGRTGSSTRGSRRDEAPETSQQPDSRVRTGGAGGGIGGMSGYGAGMTGRGMGMMGGGMGASGRMMGGMGMMGASGGGMMGTGMGGMYSPVSIPGTEQSLLARLCVELDDEIKPAAREFAEAVIENLRLTLFDLHERHVRELEYLVELAERQRSAAEGELAGMLGAQRRGTDASPQVREALDTIVDLSALSPDMSLEDAVEMLKHSVTPPLQIAVMWKDLAEHAEIEGGEPITIDALPNVRVETALKVLLKAVSTELIWKMEGNVIVIGTNMTVTLEPEEAVVAEPQPAMDVRDLAALRQALARDIQQLELDLAGTEARREAIQEQMARTQRETAERLEEDAVTRELEKLVEMNLMNMETLRKHADAGRISQAELGQANENLMKAKIELARRREELSKSAGGARLEKFNDELSEMAIDTAEREAQVEILRRQLFEVDGQWSQASAFNPTAARIRMAQETLSVAENRVSELNKRRANLQPPTVTMIGAN